MTLLKVNQPGSGFINNWMDDLLNDFPTTFAKTFKEDAVMPQVNIKEAKDTYLLELVAPGRNKEDFKINVEKNILTVSYDKKDEQKTEDEKYIRREFNFKSFKRTFTLDEKVTAENIEAKYENGVLKLNLPKKEEVKVATKEIAVQ